MAFRRVVTGFNSAGQKLHQMGQRDRTQEPAALTTCRCVDHPEMPAETATDDPSDRELGTSLAGGWVFRSGVYAPGNIARQPQLEQSRPNTCVMAFVLIATEGAKTTGWDENKAH